MAVLILLVAGIGVGYLLRGSGDVEQPTELVKAKPLNGAVPVSATLERTATAATLHVHELPAITEDEVYEVWVQRAGVMEPRSTFVLSIRRHRRGGGPGSARRRQRRLRHPRAARRQPPADDRPAAQRAAVRLSERRPYSHSPEWRPATDTPRARRTSPARTAAGRSAPTA